MVATSMTRAALSAVGANSELVVKHLHRVGTVRRILPNGRALVLGSHGDDWISNQVYWRGWAGYETEMPRCGFTSRPVRALSSTSAPMSPSMRSWLLTRTQRAGSCV